MKFRLLFLVFLISFSLFSQVENETKLDTVKRTSLIIDHKKDKPKATISQYRIITLERDTTFVDTSLTIKKEYDYNYLRRDLFGLMPFANEGQATLLYNTPQNCVLLFPNLVIPENILIISNPMILNTIL